MNKNQKTKIITFRVTEDEYFDIKMKAESAGFSVSELIHKSLLTSKIVSVDNELERYKIFLASRLSNNINQIACRLNTDYKSGAIDDKTYNQILIVFNKIIQFLKMLLHGKY